MLKPLLFSSLVLCAANSHSSNYDFLGPQEGGFKWRADSNGRSNYWELSAGIGLPFILQGTLTHSLGRQGFVQGLYHVTPFFGEMALWGGWQVASAEGITWRWGAGPAWVGIVDEVSFGVLIAGERLSIWNAHWGWKGSLSVNTFYKRNDGFGGVVPLPSVGIALVARY